VPERVTVIIPVHNGERHVERSVFSALAQNYPDLEVIVVDDGSTDGTRAVLARMTDERLRVVEQDNARVAAAYNRGCAEATGQILAFLDHDDEWLPGKLAVQVPYLLSSQAGAVGTLMQYMGPDSRPIDAFFGEPTEGRQQDIAAARFMPFPRSSMIMRADLFHELGGFDVLVDQHVGPVDDLEFLARLVQHGERVELLPRVLGRTRVHPGATSARRFFVMQDATRFLVARAEARAHGDDLDWAEFQALRPVGRRERLQDRGHFWYRNAGMYYAAGDRWNAARFLAGAAVLTPLYSVRRLRRQRSRHPVG
jgi:glycosyltransferase involved in cell wall biosynthesis